MAESSMMAPKVVHNTAESRYDLFAGGERAAYAEYAIDGDVITFTHTVTNPAKRGQGLAAIVVRRALDEARAAGHRVVPRCWYVAQYIDQHPSYADLLR